VIVDRVRIVGLVAVLLSVVGCSTPDIRPSDAVFDELMRKLGLWIQLAQVEPMMQAGVSQAEARTTALAEEDLVHLQKAIASAYAADAPRTTVRAGSSAV
jgi:type IV pilus biogenesis protein CpaD/CtpE